MKRTIARPAALVLVLAAALILTGCGGKELVIREGTVSIGESAYREKKRLETVRFPDSLTSIGDGAFSGCTGLKELALPGNLTSIGGSAFYGCTGLTEAALPEKLVSIGGSAFYGCTGLTSVVIPDGVTSIGSSAFQGCTGLTSVVIPPSVTSISAQAFAGCTGLTSVVIPDTVTQIGHNAFAGCTSLASLTCPGDAETEGKPFSGSGALKELRLTGERVSDYFLRENGIRSAARVTFADTVTRIGECAFSGCEGLEELEIPGTVTEIGRHAFRDCKDLVRLTCPGETVFAEKAFGWCDALTELRVTGNRAGDGLLSSAGLENISEIVFADTVTAIGEYAFRGCGGITGIVIPDGVTEIGEEAFRGCAALTSVRLPEGLLSIGSEAFRYCLALTDITIPPAAVLGESVFTATHLMDDVGTVFRIADVPIPERKDLEPGMLFNKKVIPISSSGELYEEIYDLMPPQIRTADSRLADYAVMIRYTRETRHDYTGPAHNTVTNICLVGRNGEEPALINQVIHQPPESGTVYLGRSLGGDTAAPEEVWLYCSFLFDAPEQPEGEP